VIVCVIARRIWTHGLGGLEEQARLLTTGLAAHGHAVHLLTTAHPDGRTTEPASGGTVHYLLGTPPGDYSAEFRRESRRWARENFARLGVDAVLSLSVAADGLVGLEGPPIYPIITGWGWNQLRSFWHDSGGVRRLVELPWSALWLVRTLPRSRALLRASARVICVSPEIAHQLRRYRACYLPGLVEPTEFRADPAARATLRARLGLSDADCVGLVVGTVSRQKGVHLALEASAAVAREHPAFALVVIGGGPAAAEVEADARRLAPHLRAFFLGPMDHAALPPYFAAADMLLFPSLRQEGLPTVVLEAMSAGLPVVAMRAGGTPAAVADGSTGLLVPLGDVRGFTEAARVLARNPDRRRALGRAGRERVEREFQGNVVIPRLVKILAGDAC